MSSRDSNIRAWTRHEDADWRHVINPGEAVNQVLSWRWKPTGWCRGEGWSVGTGSSLTLLLDFGMEQETWGSVSQPSIPKSSVNFLTLRRSSVLTVGRVVDRERSMSDCKVGTRTHTQFIIVISLLLYCIFEFCISLWGPFNPTEAFFMQKNCPTYPLFLLCTQPNHLSLTCPTLSPNCSMSRPYDMTG